MMRSRSGLPLFGVAIALASVVWLGCATTNGDAEGGNEVGRGTDDTSNEQEQTPRPTFEAGAFDGGGGGGDASEPAPEPPNGDTCIDKDDPGSSETTAKALPSTNDGDNSTHAIKGTLNGPVDVDFYKLHMDDQFGSSIDANFQVETTGVEMCVFVKCAAGETSVTGCSGGVVGVSSIGTKGCCATGPSQVTPQWDCPGFTDNDSADFFIRVKQTQNKCTSYSLSYHF